MDDSKLRELMEKIGYEFDDLKLLKEALIHRSYANEHGEIENINNERLEFLGDAVLELVVSTLGAAFVRIFDGLGGPQIAPPYRSFYENDKGLLCQQATAEMDHALHQHRMRLADDVNEPSDHLAIQLELMSQLALRLGETASSSQRPLSPLLVEQQDFLATHLLGWVQFSCAMKSARLCSSLR